jgi:CHASE2 domain
MNLPFELPDERLIAKINQVTRYVLRENKAEIQNLKHKFLFVNCTYDKMLIPYDDENGSGEITITNRQKLAQLLSIFNRAKEKPALVILDLLLVEPSPADSFLVTELANTQHLILGWDQDLGIIPLPPGIKLAQANYFTTSGSFLKYPVLNQNNEYLPAAIYSHLQNIPARLNWFGFVRMGNELWLNSFIVDLEMRKRYLIDNSLAYVNLGELLQSETVEEIAESAKGKIVIIGDVFVNDQHDTVLGEQPGPMIVVNAYLSMLKGQATITWKGSFLLFLFYYIFSRRTILMTNEVSKTNTTSPAPKFLRFILKYVSYLVVFSAFSILLYQLLGKHFQILLFAFYFNGLEYLIKRYDGLRKRIEKIAFK